MEFIIYKKVYKRLIKYFDIKKMKMKGEKIYVCIAKLKLLTSRF